jgi:hypothetical protein
LVLHKTWELFYIRFVGSVSSEGGESDVEMYDFFGNDWRVV